jgi:2-amino-4-hydroxy-6-hydroxymethyldihydropteridine diphosphokinase
LWDLNGIICYIGIGSNLEDALQNCQKAIENLLRKDEIQLTGVSSFYRSEPVGWENQNWFVNAVVEIKTTLSARELLNILLGIENTMGRRRGIKGGPRIIDLDILFHGHDIINEVDLIVPHPELHKRRFVLEPLNEIASYFIHPAFGISVRGLKDRLQDEKIVEMIEK